MLNKVCFVAKTKIDGMKMEFYVQMNFVCKVMTKNHTNFEA